MNRLITIVIIFFSINSCSFKKLTNVNFSIPPKNTKELIEKINLRNISPEWGTLNLKIKTTKNKQETNISSQIRIRKDSAIWVSIKAPLGIEILRSIITPDSIYFMNRIEKTYFIKPISHLKNTIKTEINYYQLQEILFASPKITNNNLKFSDSPPFSLKSKSVNYFFQSLFYKIEKMEIIESDEKRVTINFYNYQRHKDFNGKTTEILFPNFLKIDAWSDEIFTAEINYTKIEFNKKSKISFNIPNDYLESQ